MIIQNFEREKENLKVHFTFVSLMKNKEKLYFMYCRDFFT